MGLFAFGLCLLGLPVLAWYLASSRSVVVCLLGWAVPLASGVFWVLQWWHERDPSLGGDPQPGLVAAVGLAMTVPAVAGALVGSLRPRGR